MAFVLDSGCGGESHAHSGPQRWEGLAREESEWALGQCGQEPLSTLVPTCRMMPGAGWDSFGWPLVFGNRTVGFTEALFVK